MSQRYMQL